jgi:hypothetical protein
VNVYSDVTLSMPLHPSIVVPGEYPVKMPSDLTHGAISEVRLASDINTVLHAQHKPSSISHGQQVVPQCL